MNATLNREQAELAERLAAARQQGHALPRSTLSFDQTAAYAVQEAVYQHLDLSPAGWKVGSTSREAQQKLGTDEPGAGRLLREWCYRDGGEIPVHEAHDVQIEVEFAFRTAHALVPRDRPYTRSEVSAAIDTVMPAIEIVGSRFASGLAGSGRALVTADGGANIAFAHGPESAWRNDFNLPEHDCALLIGGAEIARGNGARALDDPMNVLVWLANHLRQREIELTAGSLVTAGTCTGLVPIAAGDDVCGDFGRLGRVRATITSAN